MRKSPISETARIKVQLLVQFFLLLDLSDWISSCEELDPFTVVFMLTDFSPVVLSRDMLPLKNIYSLNNGLMYR